jgi:pimeloyl-ACP methyl ester carboxylesterase
MTRDGSRDITWGKNDGIFTVEGAELYKRDIPSAELHLFDTGHFALEEEVDRIGSLMHEFLDRTINKRNKAPIKFLKRVM